MGRILLFFLCAAASHKKHKPKHPAADAAPASKLETWQKTHPDAALSLGEWVQANPSAARLLFAWDERSAKSAKNAQALLAWTLKQESGEATDFMTLHADWSDFAPIVQSEQLGVDRLMRWCRDHPKAAEELENAPAPLAWLGKNLYREQLQAAPASGP
jgi:hypothetical protein